MKHFLSFLCGVVCAVWLCPPTPSVEVDDMTRREIAYEVIEYLEQNEFDSIAARRAIVKQNRSWF